jgi:uncharacterized protein YjbI with pentapeptide repeats
MMQESTIAVATFERCKLPGADMSEAKALGVTFNKTLLIYARLPGFSFHKQTLKRIEISYADLRSCDFRGTIFDERSLCDANMLGSRFGGANLGGLRLINAFFSRRYSLSREGWVYLSGPGIQFK